MPIEFYGGPFSNFVGDVFPMPWPWGPERHAWYATVEHWFQACKASTEAEHERIRLAPSPGAAKRLGRACQLRSDWEDVKYEVMLQGLRAKFAPGTTWASTLLATGDEEIREDSPTDFVWGWRNGGQNLLGKALMQVRAELRALPEETYTDSLRKHYPGGVQIHPEAR